MAISEPYRLSELEEVIGDLHRVENTEIGPVAIIGKIQVLLPEDLAVSLKGLLGRRVGIIRLNGYRVRSIDR